MNRYSTMTLKIWLVLGGVLVGALVLSGCKLTRWGYESAAYRVVRKSGPFEIRQYQPLALVSTPMASAEPSDNQSFMRLFGYISGENQAGQKIAMTTPVFVDQTGTNREMSFVLPQSVADAGAPKAQQDAVRFERREGGWFAVYRFAGSWAALNSEKARNKLMDWVAAEKLEPIGEPEVANYDPPFTPAFMRRNEVMVRVKASAPGAP